MTMKSNFQSRKSPPCISSWASGIDHVVTCHKKWIQLTSSVMIYGISRKYTNWDIKMNILFGLSPYNFFLNGPLVMPQWFNYNQIKLYVCWSPICLNELSPIIIIGFVWGISMRLHSISGRTKTKQVPLTEWGAYQSSNSILIWFDYKVNNR